MTAYTEFLKSKRLVVPATGHNVPAEAIHPLLFDFQRDIVRWALRKGRAAIFAECGMGKTLMQIEWARHVAEHTGGRVLILAPLAVAHQTVGEGAKIGVQVAYMRGQDQIENERLVITNYEMAARFDPSEFAGVVLDESSILKAFTGKTKRMLINMFGQTPYRLCCTATPAPNDHLELGNHSQFLGVMDSNAMISRWFINDTMAAGSYRLKRHAERDFWRWVTSWAVCISKPSDLGDAYSDHGFMLPELRIHERVVRVDHTRAFEQGQLILAEAPSATSMWREKRATMADRCRTACDIVGDSDEPWIIWCDTNAEADELKRLFPKATEVRGSDSIREKERKLIEFSEGRARQIITKPDIAGFGLNWQHCSRQVFVGVTYSFEKTYQALRRSWRFGQTRPVDAYLIYAETEGNVRQTLAEKREAHRQMQSAMNEAMRENGLEGITNERGHRLNVRRDETVGEGWRLLLGDCIERVKEVETASVDFTIFSPPFSTLYIYSDLPEDMGNCEDDEEFFRHFGYLIPELLRVSKAGRLCAVHCKDLPLYRNRDGVAGLRDFPGEIIRAFESAGWTYHSRVTIWKDPVIEMQRTKNHGLLWKNFTSRGEVCRQGMPDYLVVFRKWADEMPDKQVRHEPSSYIGIEPPTSWDGQRDFSIQVWQKYASPVWFDINQMRVLNVEQARDSQDEKHICPLQLDVIARCIEIWTNPGDLVFSPFAGIGSEGYEAVRMKRRFLGIELKESYWRTAIGHLARAALEANEPTLFEFAEGFANEVTA